jgi:hypothetical protein
MHPALRLVVAIAPAAVACVPPLPGGTLEGTGGSAASGAGNTGGLGGAGGIGGMGGNGFVLVTNPGRGLNIAADSGYVYWAGGSPSTSFGLMKASVLDGKPVSLTSPCAGTYTWVAVDSSNVYCADLNATSGRIARVAIDGSQATTIVAGTSINAAAAGPDGVYWVTNGGEVLKVGAAGGSPTRLAVVPGYSRSLAVYDGNVYWLVGRTDLSLMVMKVAASGGDPVELARVPSSPNSQIAVDTTGVYWVNTDVGTLMKVGLEGGATEQVFTDATRATSVAADGTGFYWTDDVGGIHVNMTPTRTRLITAGTPARAVALDATHVFWFCSTALCMAPK